MYNFVFDRRALVLVAGGLVFAGGLLFFGGVLVGVSWVVPYQSRVATLAPPQRPMLPPEPATPVAEPPPGEQTPEVAAEDPAELAPEATVAPDDFAAVSDPSTSDPSIEEAGLESEPAAAEAPAPAPAPAPVAEETAAASSYASPEANAPQSATESAVPEGGYAVQVGAFVQPKNSAGAVQELESRGYEPYVESITNARGRLFHTVRIGRYPDREAAVRAASDFRHRERMAAIVQPVGTL